MLTESQVWYVYLYFLGHEKHEYTSGFAIDDVFRFLENKVTAVGNAASAAAAAP
jgi:hypothetical protein